MRRIALLTCCFGGLLLALLLPSVSTAALRAPAPVTPRNRERVQQFPAITWGGVRGAVGYEYQVASDPRFNSIVLGTGPGRGSYRTRNLAAALEKNLPDGTYYWRVRAVSAKDQPGRWSRTRTVVKHWTTAPGLTRGNGADVAWPETPLVLEWSAVPYATKYIVTVATDPALSNIVVGSTMQPVKTQGTNFALPVSLDPGSYYWAITPLDSAGHPGVRSAVGTFKWTWNSFTTPSLTDLNPDPRVFDPLFSWQPVAGASAYEVEVNAAESFPPGSRWFLGKTTGTSIAPPKVLANNRYYWRVRAFDAKGNAGAWNEGEPFTKQFDSVEPSIPNLTVRNTVGEPLHGVPVTDTPIVTWDPVPGASRYEVQLTPHTAFGCDWSQVTPHQAIYQAETATTAWTPLGYARESEDHIGPTAWPRAQDTSPALPSGVEYCLRVLARSDDDAESGQVVSAWTQINGFAEAAFDYAAPTAPGAPETPFATKASDYLVPAPAQALPRTPLFTWKPVPGAQGYYVVVARDAAFTEVADVGFTNVTAYAPRLANEAPLSDETTSYYWAVIPAANPQGSGVFDDLPRDNNFQSFNKSSAPPTPLTPTPGSVVSSQPTFRWTGAENARNYRIQVSQDPAFGHPLDDVTTDATAYTPSMTYPADTVLYWRVRATDWTGQGLNWSPTETFVRTLPAPTNLPIAGTGGPAIPALTWTPVAGAIGYEVQAFEPDGKSKVEGFEAPSASVIKYFGTGVWRWQIRADFPSGVGTGRVGGAFSSLESYVFTLPAPSGARGVKSGARMLVSWKPASFAKEYVVEVANTSGFTSRLESHRVEGTSWAPNIDLAAKRNHGTLYWRVAAIDWGGNVGSYASGNFGSPRPTCKRSRVHKHGSCRRHGH